MILPDGLIRVNVVDPCYKRFYNSIQDLHFGTGIDEWGPHKRALVILGDISAGTLTHLCQEEDNVNSGR